MDATPTLPTITTQVEVVDVLVGASAGRGENTPGQVVHIFADGRLVGVVEVPELPFATAELELVAHPVHERTDGLGWTPARCRFPNGGQVTIDPADVEAIEAEHAAAQS